MFNRSKAFRSLLISCSICFCFVVSASAQDPTPTPKSDAPSKLVDETKKIKEQIVNIGTGSEITIIRRDGDSLHGSITKIDIETVTVNDVDLKTNVEINYQQIKKVDKGYSPADALTGKRPRPKTHMIITIVTMAAGALIPLIIWAANRGPKTITLSPK